MIAARRALLALVLLATGCTHAPEGALARVPLPPLRQASLDEVRAAWDRHCAPQTLRASGDLEVADTITARTQRLSVTLLATREGRLYLKGSVAVVSALEVVGDGARFWFLVPSKNTVWTGAAARAPGASADPTHPPYEALRPLDVTRALVPAPVALGPGETISLEGERLGFTLTVARRSGTVRERIALHRDTLRPQRLRLFDDAGNLQSDVSWSHWEGERAQAVEILRPADGYRAAFTFSKMETDAPAPEKAFVPRVPPDYATVEVK